MNPFAAFVILGVWLFWGWQPAVILLLAYLAACFFIGVGKGLR